MHLRNRTRARAGLLLAAGLWAMQGAVLSPAAAAEKPRALAASAIPDGEWPIASATAAAPVGRGPHGLPAPLTLQQAIDMARTQSPSALAAIHRYRASHWQYVTFKAEGRPSLNLESAPLAWDRTISRQTLPTGADAFVPRSQANSTADLALSKVITRTGGTISLRSQLARTSALEGTGGLQYFSTPVAVTLSQPLFAFNPYAWNQRVEPGRYAEARQQFVEELESVSATAIAYFFDVLSAQTSLRDALTEKIEADTLFAVTRRRFLRGRTSESDVLQAELAGLNADLRLTRARLDLSVQRQRLASFLGVGEAPALDLAPVVEGPVAEVELVTACREARRNRPEAISFDRQLIDAERSVAEARSSRGSTWLTASYGLSRSTESWVELYRQPRVDQRAQISIHVPILDWGRSQARVAVAESQREVTRRQVERARADFDRDVFLRVSQFDIQARQLRLAAHADSVAGRRLRLTRDGYLAGRGDLNSLNIAQAEKDNARRVYLDAIRNYWASYYDVRRATLYDFERGAALRPPDVVF